MKNSWLVFIVMATVTLLAGCQRREATPVHFTTQEWTFKEAKGSKLTSDHYILYTTCKSKPFVDALPGFLETCWAEYEKLLGAKSIDKPCETYLFQSRGQWERFTDEFAPGRAATYRKIRSGGYSERGLTVSHYDTQRSTLSVLAHEGLHQYLEVTRGRDIPPWLNEGLACNFESFDLDEHNRPVFKPEKNTMRSPGLREALMGKSLIPLKEILSTHAGLEVQKKAAHVRNYYAQEWALVLYLSQPSKRNPYHDGFMQLLSELGSEQMMRKANALIAADTDGNLTLGEAVFRSYITDDLAKFEEDYEAYLHKLLDMPA